MLPRMKIGISGANGHLGQAVLKRLNELPGDHETVGISRSPQAVKHADEARLGDYDRPETLQDAYAGLDRLLIIPSLDIRYGVRGQQLIAAIDAALIAGVGHIVLMSDVGTREETEPVIGYTSWVSEQQLIKSAASWTILRASYFMESYAQEVLLWRTVGRLAEVSENRIGFVSRDDVAAAAAGILVGEGHSGAIYNATGPEALSAAERAALISKITDEPMGVIQTSLEELPQELLSAGFPEDYVGMVVTIRRKISNFDYDIVTGDVERLSGRRPTSFKEVLTACMASDTS